MPPIVRLGTAFYAGVIVAALLWALVFGQIDVIFGERSARFMPLSQGVLIGLIIVGLCHLANAFVRPFRRSTKAISRMVGPLSVRQALWLAVLSGFAEELLFRGALWPQLGLMGSAVLFGILHTIPSRALVAYPIFAFLAGIALGALREHTGSIFPAVLCHITVNALNLLWITRGERRRWQRRVATFSPEPSRKRQQAVELPVPQEVGDAYPKTVWRYHLRVELTGTDRQNLPDCLEAEDLALFQAVPREEVYAQLHEGLFVYADEYEDPYVAFPEDIAVFSTYLFQIVTGVEIAERWIDEETIDDVRAWKITSRRGDSVQVPLVVDEVTPKKFEFDPDREDLDVLAAQWDQYPRWFQDGMRFKYPSLR